MWWAITLLSYIVFLFAVWAIVKGGKGKEPKNDAPWQR